jgi:hypothetical protein
VGTTFNEGEDRLLYRWAQTLIKVGTGCYTGGHRLWGQAVIQVDTDSNEGGGRLLYRWAKTLMKVGAGCYTGGQRL